MARILVVDDDQMVRDTIKKYASLDGHEVGEADDGYQAISILKPQQFDIVIMDIMLPELDGFCTIREIRKSSNVPIIILSSLSQLYDKVYGFEVGADDYVTKPFYPQELMMRVKAILSRCKSNSKSYDKAKFEDLEIDYSARIVTINGQIVDLAFKEYELLAHLSKNNHVALSRESLLISVWGYDYYGDDRTLDTHIKNIRRKLGNYSKLITTVRNVGYRFDG